LPRRRSRRTCSLFKTATLPRAGSIDSRTSSLIRPRTIVGHVQIGDDADPHPPSCSDPVLRRAASHGRGAMFRPRRAVRQRPLFAIRLLRCGAAMRNQAGRRFILHGSKAVYGSPVRIRQMCRRACRLHRRLVGVRPAEVPDAGGNLREPGVSGSAQGAQRASRVRRRLPGERDRQPAHAFASAQHVLRGPPGNEAHPRPGRRHSGRGPPGVAAGRMEGASDPPLPACGPHGPGRLCRGRAVGETPRRRRAAEEVPR
jgi:hypothetical protein